MLSVSSFTQWMNPRSINAVRRKREEGEEEEEEEEKQEDKVEEEIKEKEE